MKDEWKIYIRGVYNRGKEVIKTLEDYGASNPRGYIGDYDRALYFINHNDIIDCTRDHDAEFAKIIVDNYTELHLPDKWKDGDILISNDGTYYKVFLQYDLSHIANFYAYNVSVSIKNKKIMSGEGTVWVCDRKDYRLATSSEVEHFHELLHKNGKDWDSKKKQLVNWKWKPKDGEDYWTVIVGITIYMRRSTWISSAADEIRYELGNCFRTCNEADAILTKVKLLFNKE